MPYNFLIIGAGFSGSVLANRLQQALDCRIEIWDERSHIGGNCYTERDSETGIMVHKYGPHIFNTDKKEIWDFVNSFVEFKPYVHRVKAMSGGKVYSLPVNLSTINHFFGKRFTPLEAEGFIKSLADQTIADPANFEEQAMKFIGKDLYRAFFYGYTKKQWGCEPSALPASILKRIPVRFNYDDSYHNNIFSGIPVDGYTALFDKLLAYPTINVRINKKFDPEMETGKYDHVFYTGPLDAYFNHKYGRLGYRTVTFESSVTKGDYQGVAQMNYCDENIPFTRITEHKHFCPWEQNEKTIYFKEYSHETGAADIPYYPKRLETDKSLLRKYREEAAHLRNISFIGRLATYRYMDMHNVIGEALDYSKIYVTALENKVPPPVFADTEK
ncbi:MAG: UDP-galactopyranose mutase [Ginsengibacter sp.]